MSLLYHICQFRGGVSASAQAKKAAARKLVKIYAQLKEDVPASIKNMAS